MESLPIDDGGAAFATSRSFAGGSDHPGQRGMALRDYFAGVALQSLCRTFDAFTRHAIEADVAAATAQTAYRLADAMIAARATPPQNQ
jgi:hypothetical protein